MGILNKRRSKPSDGATAMKKAFKDFFYGVFCTLKGIKIFYSTPKLWKYALIPLLIVLLIYWSLVWSGIYLAKKLSGVIEGWFQSLPENWQWVGSLTGGMTAVMVFIIFWITLMLFVSTLYEVFGGVFFDRLITRFESISRNKDLPEPGWRFEMRAFFDACFYAIMTLLLILPCLLLHLLPYIGVFLIAIIFSYRYSISYLAMTGFRHGMLIPDTKKLAAKNFALIMGYGISVYLFLQLPFVVILFLPGIILGNVLVFQRMQQNKENAAIEDKTTA